MFLTTREVIRDVANNILTKLNITKPHIDIYAIAETYNIKLHIIPLPNSISGTLTTLPQDDSFLYIVCLNSSHSNDRRSFTLAHELGHIVLEHTNQYIGKQYKEMNIKKNKEKKIEREADIFASEILMPEQMFKASYMKYSSPLKLSRIYYVSVQAVKIRINELGLEN